MCNSDIQGLSDEGHLDLPGILTHCQQKWIGIRYQQRECTVVAGNDCLKVKKVSARHGGRYRVHGEPVANGNDPCNRFMNAGDQPHVSKDVGIAHMIKRFFGIVRPDDDPARVAQIYTVR